MSSDVQKKRGIGSWTLALLALMVVGCMWLYGSGLMLAQSSPTLKQCRPSVDVDTRAPASANGKGWVAYLEGAKQLEGQQPFSQGIQDFLLERIFEKIGMKYCGFVEFGFGYMGEKPIDTEYDMDHAAAGLNTRLLAKKGWHGNYFDALVSAPKFNVTRTVLTEENIGEVFKSRNIPADVDYVSIDVDSIEAWLLRGMLYSGFRPRVVSVEYNPNFGQDAVIAAEKTWSPWTFRSLYGAGIGAINHLLSAADYRLVHVMKGGYLDAFFVRNDILALHFDVAGIPTYKELTNFLPVRAHPPCEREDLLKMVHVPTSIDGNEVLAHQKAVEYIMKMPTGAPKAWGGDGEICKPEAFRNLWMFPGLGTEETTVA